MNKLLCLLLLFSLGISAQERKPVQGRIVYGSLGLKDVLVVNNNAQAETRTDSLGNFSLKMQVGDLLIVSDRTIQTKKVRYTPDVVKNGVIMISVIQVIEEIEEVVINRSRVTTASLGIPTGKKYTPAERRLKTAGDFKPVHLLGLLAGSLQVDPILNTINGKTKRLKKEISVERREQLLARLWATYTKAEINEIYKIPEDYTNGFAYYVIEDAAFSTALEAGDKLNADLHASELSTLFLKNIGHED